ncbi:MAG: universal stress protein [Syntrophobacteraceae bacterium]|jgi:nucleotide-binding universal stress UspA family protein|nr:universal stress protein [Syntrophobacteraceae bacterium]
MEPKRIVCGVTASTRAQRAVLEAARLARELGARLTCVHVIDRSFLQHEIDDALSRAFLENALVHLGIEIVEHAAQIAQIEGITVDKHLLKGSVGKCLHKVAGELRADLLVLGGEDGRPVVREIPRPAVGDELPPGSAHCPSRGDLDQWAAQG